jgi:subtilisin family serine protease
MPNPSDDERKARQAEDTRDALRRGHKKVRIHPDDDPAQAEYMFQENVILCRNQHVAAVRAAIEQLNLGPWNMRRNTPIDGVVTIEVPDNRDLDALCQDIDRAAQTPGIVMPNHIVHITIAGNCPATEPVLAPGLPDPALLNDPSANGANVSAYVIDTGRIKAVEAAHAWLGGIHGQTEGSQVGRYSGHGTFVCGVLRAIAPKADISVRALMMYEGAVIESDLAVDLAAAVAANPDIICMSAGTTTRGGYPPVVLERICQLLETNNHTVLVAAAGNDGDTTKFYPAAFSEVFDSVISVGATESNGSQAVYSNRGWPTVYARGSEVVNAYPNIVYTYVEPPNTGNQVSFINGMASWSGTSFSTPLVAGLLAAQVSKNLTPPRQAWAQLFGKASNATFGPCLAPNAAISPP